MTRTTTCVVVGTKDTYFNNEESGEYLSVNVACGDVVKCG